MKPATRSTCGVTRAAPVALALLADVRGLILAARQTVARALNAGLVLLYWKVGQRIRKEVLREKRAEYGEEIVSTLSKQLTAEFGNGFSKPNLSRMMRLAEVLPDEKVIASLARHLGWSHFVEIIPFKDPLQRDFYAEMCRVERWSVRTLRAKIGGMLFERTALIELEARGIRVAKYLTELPPRKLLAQKLHDAVRLARARLGEEV